MSAFILGWQIYFLDYLAGKSELVGVLLVFFMISMLFGRMVSEFLHSKMKMSLEDIISISLLALCIGFIILFIFGNIPSFIIGSILIELSMGIFRNTNGLWTQNCITTSFRSSFYSALSTVNGITTFLLSLLLGLIIKIDLKLIWALAGIIVFINLIYFRNKLYKVSTK